MCTASRTVSDGCAPNTPDETEQALYRATASRWWPYINLYLVTWGQNVCRPVYPRCGACAIRPYCPQVGVTVTSKNMRTPIRAIRAFLHARICLIVVFWLAHASADRLSRPPRAGPIVVVETTKGTFAFETYPREAPKTVAHIVALVRRGFYDGQRVHRAIPGLAGAVGRSAVARRCQGSGLGTRSRRRRAASRSAPPKSRQKRLHVGGRRGDGPSGSCRPRRQPDVRHPGGAARSGRVLHRLRPGHRRRGCTGEAAAGRRDYADVACASSRAVDDVGQLRVALEKRRRSTRLRPARRAAA